MDWRVCELVLHWPRHHSNTAVVVGCSQSVNFEAGGSTGVGDLVSGRVIVMMVCLDCV